MAKANDWKKKIEFLLLIIIFSANIYLIPRYYLYTSEKFELQNAIEILKEPHFIIELRSFTPLEEELYELMVEEEKEIISLGYEELLIRLNILDILQNKYAERLREYEERLREYEGRLISLDNLRIKFKGQLNKLESNNLHEANHSKTPQIVDPRQLIIRHTNFTFLVSIIITCLGVIVVHKVKNNKFITMSDFFLIVITISTCFTSGNHLFNTVPNFIDRIGTFDAAIFALGPVAVIWLSIKGIIDLLNK